MPSSRKNRGSRHRSHKQHQRHRSEDIAEYEVDADLRHGPLPNIDSPEWPGEPLPAWVEGPSVLKQDTEIAARGLKRRGQQEGGEDCQNVTGFRGLSKRKKGEVSMFETEGGSSTPSSLDRWDGGDSRADDALSLLTSIDSGRGDSRELDFNSFKASVTRLDVVGGSVSGHEANEYKGEGDGKYRKGRSGTSITAASKTIVAVDMLAVGHPDINPGDSNIRIKNRIGRRRDLSEVEQDNLKSTFDIEPNSISSSKGQPCESNASDSGKTSTKKSGSARRSDKDALRREMSLAVQYSHSPDADSTLETERKKGKLGDNGMGASAKPRKSEEYQKFKKSEETQRYRKSDDATRFVTGDNTGGLEEPPSFLGEAAKSSTGLEWTFVNDNRNLELEKELENRIRRRRGESGDRDRWRDDERDREAKRRHHQRDHHKREEKYKDDSRNRDDKLKDERNWDEKIKDDRERSIGRHRDEKDREGRITEDKQIQGKEKDERQKYGRESSDRYKDDTDKEERHRVDKDSSDRHIDEIHKDRQREDKGKIERDNDDKHKEDRDGRRKDDKQKDTKHKSEKEREDRQKDSKNYNGCPRTEKHKDEIIKLDKDHMERSKEDRNWDDGLWGEKDRFARQKDNNSKNKDKGGDDIQRDERTRLEEDGVGTIRGETFMGNDSKDEKRKDLRSKNGKDQLNKLQEERIRADKDLGDKDKYGRYRDDRDENSKKRENKNKVERSVNCKEDADKLNRMGDGSKSFERPKEDKDMHGEGKRKRDEQCQDNMPRDDIFKIDKDALEKQKDVKDKDDRHKNGSVISGMHKDDKYNTFKHRDGRQREDGQHNSKMTCGGGQIQLAHSDGMHEVCQNQDNKQIDEKNKEEKYVEMDWDTKSGHEELLSKKHNDEILHSHSYEDDLRLCDVHEIDQIGRGPMEAAVGQEKFSAMASSSGNLDASVRGPWPTLAQEIGSGSSMTSEREHARQRGRQGEPEGSDSYHEPRCSRDGIDSGRNLELPHDVLIQNRVDQMLDNCETEAQVKSTSPQYETGMPPQFSVDSSPVTNCWPPSSDAQRSPSPPLLDRKYPLSFEKSGHRNKFDASISASGSSGTWWPRERGRHSSDHMEWVKQQFPGEEVSRNWETRILHRELDDGRGKSSSPERTHDSLSFPGARPLVEEDLLRGSTRGIVIEREHRRSFSQSGAPPTVRRGEDVTRERADWAQHGMEVNRQLSSPMARPQLATLPAHPSGPSGLLPPPPPFRPGIDNPAVLGPSNVFEALVPRGSGRYERKASHYKRAEMGQAPGPGDAWRGVGLGSWNVHTQGPGPSNMFSRFPPQAGVHPSGYLGIGHQFPVPPFFGMSGGSRPSAERGFPGGRFHVGDNGVSFHSSGPVMGWHRPGELDDTCPPHQGHLDTWDGKGPYADEHQRYGRHDWDQSVQGIIRRGWERGSEVWQSHRLDVDAGFNAPPTDRGASFQVNFGGMEALIIPQGQQTRDWKLPLERPSLKIQGDKNLHDQPPASTSEATIATLPLDGMESSKRAVASKQVLLSNLDVSAELAGGNLYRQYLNLLPASEAKRTEESAMMEDNFDEAAEDEFDMELDLEAEILLSDLKPHSQFLLPVSPSIFKAALDLYKRPVNENHKHNSALASLFPETETETETESSQSTRVQLESIADQTSSPQAPDTMHVSAVYEGTKDAYFSVEDSSCIVIFPVTAGGSDDNAAVSVGATVVKGTNAIMTGSADNLKGNAEVFLSIYHDQENLHPDEELLENDLCLGDTVMEVIPESSLENCGTEAAGSIPCCTVVRDIPDQLRSIAIEIDVLEVAAAPFLESNEGNHVRIEVEEQAVLAQPVFEGHRESEVLVNSCSLCSTANVIDWTTRSIDEKSMPSELPTDSSLFEKQGERGVSEAEILREGCVREQLQDGRTEKVIPLLGDLEDSFGLDGMRGKSKPQQSPQRVCENTH